MHSLARGFASRLCDKGANTCDFGTYRIVEQLRLRSVCALPRTFSASIHKLWMYMKTQTKIETFGRRYTSGWRFYFKFKSRICVKYIKLVYWPKYRFRVRWLIIIDAADAIFISRSFSLNIRDSDKKVKV